MRLRPQDIQSYSRLQRHILIGLLMVLVVAMLAPVEVEATCAISLQTGSVVTIDGQRGTGEWDDARLLSSSGIDSGCLHRLLDVGSLSQDITVFSKRYTRSGQAYAGFLFEVQDSSRDCPGINCPAFGLLKNGEKVVLQFNPNNSVLPTLEHSGSSPASGTVNNDYKIIVTHKWEPTGVDPNRVQNVGIEVFNASDTGSLCIEPASPSNRWSSITPSSSQMPAAAVRKDLSGGYRLEVEVPFALLGNPLSDVGIAFAVINDWGLNCTTSYCDGSGTGFPSSLLVSNIDNPVNGCQVSWIIPTAWGQGYFIQPPGDVFFSHMPEYWFSEDVTAHRCADPIANYDYYPSQPCKVRVKARLRSSSGSPQTRNVVFAWARNGVGQPEWKVFDIQEGVTVPVTSTELRSSIDWTVPRNLSDHPCVRVFILPPSYIPSFDKGRILTLGTDAELQGMITAYGLDGNDHAQRNITRITGTTCSDATCLASLLNNYLMVDWLSTPVAYADQSLLNYVKGQDQRAIALLPEERNRFQDGNVIVQVNEYGYTVSRGESRYNFIQPMGATIKLFPVEMVREVLKAKSPGLPFQLVVGNPGKEDRVVTLSTQVAASPPLTPTELPDFKVALAKGPMTIRGGEQVDVKGAVGHKDSIPDSAGGGTAGGCFDWFTKVTGITLAAGLLAIGIVVRIRPKYKARG